jgi:Fe-S cluster assembly ATP-binding protein
MEPILEIRELSVNIEEKKLLHNVNLTLPVGEVHALLGPNGCGKTTLLMTIMGYTQYRVTQGHIYFEQRDITDLDITRRARIGIGIAQQRPPNFSGVTLRHLTDYFESDVERHHEVDQLANAYHLAPFLDRAINTGLSGGEIKRSELFQLLITQPKLSLIDEPDSGIDLEALVTVGHMVNTLLIKNHDRPARRRTALIITHTGQILDYVHMDKAHIMLNGQIVCSGNPHILLEEIRRVGYEGCVQCMRSAQEVAV